MPVVDALRRRLAAISCMAFAACTSSMFGSDESPFSQAEVTHALSPLRRLEQRCYAGSSSARAERSVSYEFIAYVDERGDVHADPVDTDARDPALLECLRSGIDALRFPAKGADQFRLAFALRP